MAASSTNTLKHFLSAKRAKFLREPRHLCDCILLVGNADANNVKKFHCHRVTLTSASPMFERMLCGDFKESSLKEIRLEHDIEPIYFEKFLNFIYYKDNKLLESFSIDTLKNLIYLGNMYLVKPLTDACVNIIKNKSIKDLYEIEIIEVFELAHYIENADLIKQITECIRSIMKCGNSKNDEGMGSMTVSSLIICPYIYEMSSCIFYEFVKALKQVTTEIQRFRLIETYVLINSNVLKDLTMLKKILSLIDFNKMNVKEFCDGPGKSKLLNFKEKYESLNIICQAGV